ncbi:MAG: mechanosensitive ion channel family protein, partial [Bdellovibrionales bacterium]|nr:mechanosensitive ion channel family protein [Bdellovibrionales bacterium]
YGKHEDTFSYHALIAIEKPIGLLLASGFGFLCLNTLALEGFVLSFLVIVLQIILSIGFIWCAYCFSDAISFTLSRIAEKTESDLDDHLVPLLSRSIRVFIVVVGVLVAIQNLGFNVMSILAGLGIGGLAFALAAKDTAANLFGSIMILVDRPFKIGDWIVAGKSEGVVEEIGFRSTRIRTFYNSQISIPNSILANIDIDNMGRRDYRRFKATLGVVYSTSNTQLQSFLLGIREILRKNENVQKDNFQVYFTEYASSSLEILVYCHLKVPSWSDELRVKENILFEIMLLAESLNVVFAFPTRTLYLESFPQSLK